MRLVLCFLFLSTWAYSQSEGFETATSIKNPFQMRDPFESPEIKPQKTRREKDLIEKGIFNNSPNPDTLRLDGLILKGVILNGDQHRAIFQGREGASGFLLLEGSSISNGRVILKAILPRAAIFVEKIINIYGQPEYLETVIPISE